MDTFANELRLNVGILFIMLAGANAGVAWIEGTVGFTGEFARQNHEYLMLAFPALAAIFGIFGGFLMGAMMLKSANATSQARAELFRETSTIAVAEGHLFSLKSGMLLESEANRLQMRSEVLHDHTNMPRGGRREEYPGMQSHTSLFCAHAIWMWLGFCGALPMCAGIFYMLDQNDDVSGIQGLGIAAFGFAIISIGFLRYLGGPSDRGPARARRDS